MLNNLPKKIFIAYKSYSGQFVGFINETFKKNYIFNVSNTKRNELLYFFKYLNYDGSFQNYTNIKCKDPNFEMTNTITYDSFLNYETKIYDFSNLENLNFLIKQRTKSIDLFCYKVLEFDNLDKVFIFKSYKISSLFNKDVDHEYNKIYSEIKKISDKIQNISLEQINKFKYLNSIISADELQLNIIKVSFKNIDFDFNINTEFKEIEKNRLYNLLRAYYTKISISGDCKNKSLKKIYRTCFAKKQDIKFEVKINKIKFTIYLNKIKEYAPSNTCSESFRFFQTINLWESDIDKFIEVFGNLPVYDEIIDRLEKEVLC